MPSFDRGPKRPVFTEADDELRKEREAREDQEAREQKDAQMERDIFALISAQGEDALAESFVEIKQRLHRTVPMTPHEMTSLTKREIDKGERNRSPMNQATSIYFRELINRMLTALPQELNTDQMFDEYQSITSGIQTLLVDARVVQAGEETRPLSLDAKVQRGLISAEYAEKMKALVSLLLRSGKKSNLLKSIADPTLSVLGVVDRSAPWTNQHNEVEVALMQDAFFTLVQQCQNNPDLQERFTNPSVEVRS